MNINKIAKVYRKIVGGSTIPENIGKIISITDAFGTINKEAAFDKDGNATPYFKEIQKHYFHGVKNKAEGGYKKVSEDIDVKTVITDGKASEDIVRIADEAFSSKVSAQLKQKMIGTIAEYLDFLCDWTMQSRKFGETTLDGKTVGVLLRNIIKRNSVVKVSGFKGRIEDNVEDVASAHVYDDSAEHELLEACGDVDDVDDADDAANEIEYSFIASNDKYSDAAAILNGEIDCPRDGKTVYDDFGKTKGVMAETSYTYTEYEVIPAVDDIEEKLCIGDNFVIAFEELAQNVADKAGLYKHDVINFISKNLYTVKYIVEEVFDGGQISEDFQELLIEVIGNELIDGLERLCKARKVETPEITLKEVMSFAFYATRRNFAPGSLRGVSWQINLINYMMGKSSANPFISVMFADKGISKKASDFNAKRVYKMFGNRLALLISDDINADEWDAENYVVSKTDRQLVVLDAIRDINEKPIVFNRNIIKLLGDDRTPKKLVDYINKINEAKERFEDEGKLDTVINLVGTEVFNNKDFCLYRKTKDRKTGKIQYKKIGTTGNINVSGVVVATLGTALIIEK